MSVRNLMLSFAIQPWGPIGGQCAKMVCHVMMGMARGFPVEYAGGYDHVMTRRKPARGDILDEEDRRFFGMDWRRRLVVAGIKAAGLGAKDLEGFLEAIPEGGAGIAARLKMRSAANVSQALRRTKWKSLMKRLPKALAEYIVEKRFAP
jgi:hypothetical protein